MHNNTIIKSNKTHPKMILIYSQNTIFQLKKLYKKTNTEIKAIYLLTSIYWKKLYCDPIFVRLLFYIYFWSKMKINKIFNFKEFYSDKYGVKLNL
jgi:hypothetical protein